MESIVLVVLIGLLGGVAVAVQASLAGIFSERVGLIGNGLFVFGGGFLFGADFFGDRLLGRFFSCRFFRCGFLFSRFFLGAGSGRFCVAEKLIPVLPEFGGRASTNAWATH